MVIGKPLQYINVGDTLYLGDKGFKVWNMQKGKLIVDHAEPTDIQIGIIFEDYKMENIKKGATLVFREEEQQ